MRRGERLRPAVVEIRGVLRRTSKGRVYHSLRGAPKSGFWKSGDSPEGSPDYIAAYLAMVAEKAAPSRDARMTPELVDRFLASPEYLMLRDRTKKDYIKWAERFKSHFEKLPCALWEDPRTRTDLIEWRNKWAHSPKQADYAVTVAVRILNRARNEGRIRKHQCDRIDKLYKSNRAEIIIDPAMEKAYMEIAPEPARRLLVTALNTGLRVGDLLGLSLSHVEATPAGRRIRIPTSKRGRVASIPVSEPMGRVIDETPRGRSLILVTEGGLKFDESRMSQYAKYWFRRAGFPDKITLADARGTAATNLLNAGLDLREIAVHMAWSLRYASNVIDRYVALSAEMSDGILAKVEAARRAREG